MNHRILENIFVISIRPERWFQFEKRMGPWAKKAHAFVGTNGRNINKKQWITQKKIPRNCKLRRGLH